MTPQHRANVLLRLRQMHPHLSEPHLAALLDGVDRSRASVALTAMIPGRPHTGAPPAPANSNGFVIPTGLLERVLGRGRLSEPR